MARRKDNTARRVAILKPGSARRKSDLSEKPLSKKNFRREFNYQITAAIVRTIYRQKLIKIDTMLGILQALVKRLQPAIGKLSFAVERARHQKRP